MHIDILYEDEYYIAVNKPSPMLTHPTKENRQEKINLLFVLRDQIGLKLFPIHRLDRQTSGIVIFGKVPQAVTKLKEVWSTDLIRKEYKALVLGQIHRGGKFDFPLKNENKKIQNALTIYNPVEEINQCTLVDVEIRTGRRHQIRRHFGRRMQHLAGDRKYGKKKHNEDFLESYGLDRLFLHAFRFTFDHPFIFKRVTIEAPMGEDLQNVLKRMKDSTHE